MKMFAVTALAAFLPCAAVSQAACADHEFVLNYLAENHGETRNAIALSDTGVVEIWANLATGSWTITITAPDGPTCLVASGEAFTPLVEELPPMGEES